MDMAQIDLNSVKSVLDIYKSQGQSTVTTVEVIQEYHLSHRKSHLALANRSFNAQFGKFLREYESDLGIRYVREVLLHDDRINVLQSAEWVIL